MNGYIKTDMEETLTWLKPLLIFSAIGILASLANLSWVNTIIYTVTFFFFYRSYRNLSTGQAVGKTSSFLSNMTMLFIILGVVLLLINMISTFANVLTLHIGKTLILLLQCGLNIAMLYILSKVFHFADRMSKVA
jgi:hypothetical protein